MSDCDDCFQYPYECKTKNLSKPSDLTLTVESQRREGRRGYEDINTSAAFPSSPFPFPLPQLPLLPGQLRPKMRDDCQGLPGLSSPPTNPMLPHGFSPVDVTRLTLMKMMGQTHLPFLPPPFPSSDSSSSQEESQARLPGKKESDRNSREDQSRAEAEEEKNKLVVCIEVNSVKYQGILFAQSDKTKDCRQ